MISEDLNIKLKALGYNNSLMLFKPIYFRIEISEYQIYELMEFTYHNKLQYRVVEIGEKNSATNEIIYDNINDACFDYLNRIQNIEKYNLPNKSMHRSRPL